MNSTASLRAILDSVEANVFVADTDFTLVYANARALRTAADIEDELRRCYGVGVPDLLFGSIHRFHKDPANVERILRNPASFPHRATFEFGDVILGTNINSVLDAKGAIIGYTVAWANLTGARKVKESARVFAAELALASSQLTELAGSLGSQARSTADQAGTLAAGTEQMSSSIHDIASSAGSARAVAAEAVSTAESASRSIEKLNGSSTEIGGVVKLITTIAAQTNLLALNATIEAARAGDAGKGFAVVAQEVKELARETASATDRVSGMIKAIQDDSAGATASIIAITELIGRISDVQTAIAGAVEQQSTTTNEISRSVGDVAQTAGRTNTDVEALITEAANVSAKAEKLRGLVAEGA